MGNNADLSQASIRASELPWTERLWKEYMPGCPSAGTVAAAAVTGFAGTLVAGYVVGGAAAMGIGAGVAAIAGAAAKCGLEKQIYAASGQVAFSLKEWRSEKNTMLQPARNTTIPSRTVSFTSFLPKLMANDKEPEIRLPEKYQGMSVCHKPLYTPVTNGVSEQADVIKALKYHATAIDQKVSKAQIANWVALGERLIHALTAEGGSRVADGNIIVKSAAGEDIYVPSSVESTRAIMWYFTAQALWGELGKEKAMFGGAGLTAAEKQERVKDLLIQATFVFPDKGSKIFTFLKMARDSDIETELATRDCILPGAINALHSENSNMRLPSITDGSRTLPGSASRTVVNAVNPTNKQEASITVRLEGFVKDNITPMTRQQRQRHHFHAEMMKMFQESSSPGEEKHWRIPLLDELEKMPLNEILSYLVNHEHTKDHGKKLFALFHGFKNEAPTYFKEIASGIQVAGLTAGQRDKLKSLIYRALLDNIQAESNEKVLFRDNETFLMPHTIMPDGVEKYWDDQIEPFRQKLFVELFSEYEKNAAYKLANQSYFDFLKEKIRYQYSPMQHFNQRKEHEERLYAKVISDRTEEVVKKRLAENINLPKDEELDLSDSWAPIYRQDEKLNLEASWNFSGSWVALDKPDRLAETPYLPEDKASFLSDSWNLSDSWVALR